MTTNNTCVYIHTRVTDGIVFYVGIGSPRRPYQDTYRNKHWNATTAKHGYTVTILHKNLSWEEACSLEVELIEKYRSVSGDKLCNITEGGDVGARGYKHTEETREKIREASKNPSPETRAKMSAAMKHRAPEICKKVGEANKGRIHSEDARKRISESLKGKTVSEETRAKLSAAAKNRSPEHRAKISEASSNRSPETRAKLSAASKNMSPEHREKLRESAKGRTQSTETREKLSAITRGNWEKRKSVQTEGVSV